jgi:hypothetical protein
MFKCRFIHIIHHLPKHPSNEYQQRRIDRHGNKKQNFGRSLIHIIPARVISLPATTAL